MNPETFRNPPREFTLIPFWFWNDELSGPEILRQIADFESHGVFGFVIHPRVGLPRSVGWLGERMLHFMSVAIEEAARRNMTVVLYDEGMYPSGSSSGQVVAENPAFACRGLSRVELREGAEAPPLPEGHRLVAVATRANGKRIAVIHRPVGSRIRGIHYVDDDPPRHGGTADPNNPGSPRPDPPEDEPPAADLLNPNAVACFIRLVYQKLYDRFAPHFGKTVQAIFTDEPMLLGRGPDPAFLPGTTGILPHVNRLLGYDFTPHLAALWHDDEPDALRYRADYLRAVELRLEETYYQPISRWCAEHGVALTGHPNGDDRLGPNRHFQWPGQDLVWRFVTPNHPSALEGEHATMAKCSSSAAIHFRRRRNVNEFCGAYGHQLTFDEMKWLADWCFVRGVNLLVPHAFYYSVRGPRVDERPPDVGPNSAWWPRYRDFADYCRRLSWLNADCRHVCRVAILGLNNRLPWRAAKTLFRSQIDFNYVEARDLCEGAVVDESGIRLADMHYEALVLDELPTIPREAQPALSRLEAAGRLIRFSAPGEAVSAIERLVGRDATLTPHHDDLRCRHVVKDGAHVYLLHNEGPRRIEGTLSLASAASFHRLDAWTGERAQGDASPAIVLSPYETAVLVAED